MPVALTIAGSDSGAGAGIQADLLTFADFGVFGTSAITAITAQNPDGVSDTQVASPKNLASQIRQVLEFFPVRAIKTGMLPTEGAVEIVAAMLEDFAPDIPLVVDPVLVATSGTTLADNRAFAAIRNRLMPRAAVVTPNLDEIGALVGKRPIDADELENASFELVREIGVPVLAKGGHLEGEEVQDFLHFPNHTATYSSSRVENVDTHGSGCTLSAAIAADLALGHSLKPAVERARKYLQETLRNPLEISGKKFIRHGVDSFSHGNSHSKCLETRLH